MPIDIAAENAETAGRTARNDLLVSGHGDDTVAGFARSISYNAGETVQFCVTGDATTIDIYRCGWYGGDGFRQWGTVTNTPTTQPAATTIPGSNGATTCTAWTVTATWEIPETAVSGMYLAIIRSPGGGDGFWVTFVVRDDAAEADIIYKTSDSTWGAAYNHYGGAGTLRGKNVYGQGVSVGNINDRSLAVSYHRPVITRDDNPQTMWHACELPMIRWLERMGYRVKYISSVDLDRTPGILDTGKIFLSSGHDEYWSTSMRRNAESYRDRGAGHLIFSSGNEVFWKTRHDYNGDECIMWCAKDTMTGPSGYSRSAGDPLDPVTWTGTWKDTRWPSREPENLLTGTDFRLNGINDFDPTITAEYGAHPVWRNTSLAGGTPLTLSRVVGFEADSLMPARPETNVRALAAWSRQINGMRADDNGQNYSTNGILDWGIVAQGYDSGVVTIGFGTCQWGWALDGTHDRHPGTPTSLAAQQFTTNLLTDLGATAHTPHAGIVLTPPAPLTEYGAPTSSSRRFIRGDGTVLTGHLLTTDGLVPLT